MRPAFGCGFGYVRPTTPIRIRTSFEFTKHPGDALGDDRTIF